MSLPEVPAFVSTKRPLPLSLNLGDDVTTITSSDYDPLPHGKFLSTPQLLDTVRSANSVVFSSSRLVRDTIPLGPKNNVYFVVKHERSTHKKKNNFPDDCGVWDSQKGTTANSFMMLDEANKPKTVFLKNNKFCLNRPVKGKPTWVPLSPQPTDKEIIKLHRYYATLKVDENYKKRVSIVTGVDFAEVAVIEYCGTRTEATTIHGNAKRKKTPYLRTDPKVMAKIRKQVKEKSPSKVYQEMSEENSLAPPRDLKQVRDVKYILQKNLRLQYRKQISDEVLAVFSMLETHPCVRQVIKSKGKSFPCVILCSDPQLEDMKRNLSSGSVLGVDGTLKLDGCYLTTTVYENSSVLQIEPLKSPLLLGPMYVHCDTEFETYHTFFSFLRCEFFDCVRSIELKLGGDQELLLTRALKSCFPGSTLILCESYLRENVSTYLCDKAGCPSNEINVIGNKIFGDEGIINSKDLFTFGTKMLELLPQIEKYPLFLPYFEKLKPVLFSYVCDPFQKVSDHTIWTKSYHNSFEAFLKQPSNWQAQKFQHVLEKLCSVLNSQAGDNSV